ncbi:MAG: hypothetical protein KHW62_06535 [Clostridiales bacterium]|nr:hypothetical protein [Clostridiales bacterium]
MEGTFFLASCPICGRVLFRGSPSSKIEGGCPKCGEYLKISFTEHGVNAVASKREAKKTLPD